MIHEKIDMRNEGSMEYAACIRIFGQFRGDWIENRPVAIVCPGGGYGMNIGRRSGDRGDAVLCNGISCGSAAVFGGSGKVSGGTSGAWKSGADDASKRGKNGMWIQNGS